MKNVILDFTKDEKSYLLHECGFTIQETMLFNLRSDEHSLEECAESMNVSTRTAGRINKRMNSKIVKFARNNL